MTKYTITKDEDRFPIKLTVTVILDDRITADELKNIANSIKDSNVGYDNYFMLYYIKGSDPNRPAWATTHNMVVNIQGLTKEELDNILNPERIPKGQIIGMWLDDYPMTENHIILYEQNSKFYVQQTYKDGSFGVTRMHRNAKDQSKFTYENNFGEFIKIEEDGRLSWHDENGEFIKIINIQLIE